MKALKTAQSLFKPILSADSWRTLGNYVGIGMQKKAHIINDVESLADFINSRASHVAQTTPYGYLRTRTGTRFPELFENPDLLISINIAKWHVWTAWISDLSVFIGQLAHQLKINSESIQPVLSTSLQVIFEQTGQRIHNSDWLIERDDDTIFSQSPEAVYHWSPITDELKERDENIVRNSVRFRWIDIRRHTRKQLNLEKLFPS
ncbi:MAG: esterase [Gammaproteobacteria bacterium]|nr:esterase [Gammaproteobacteria bacterium]